MKNFTGSSAYTFLHEFAKNNAKHVIESFVSMKQFFFCMKGYREDKKMNRKRNDSDCERMETTKKKRKSERERIFFTSTAYALNMNDRFSISVMHSSIGETFMINKANIDSKRRIYFFYV